MICIRRCFWVFVLSALPVVAQSNISFTEFTQATIGAPATTPADIAIGISPQVLQPLNGKLPPSMPFLVFAKSCNKDINFGGYSIQLTGAGLSLVPQPPGQCSIAATLNIDPSTPPGNYQAVLRDKSGASVGHADFAVLDTAAGPIPPGSPPRVDVMWQVMGQNVCEDVFGKRVAKDFYCIEIKLGNNSGHPLQIAGIGFSSHVDQLPKDESIILANTSYAATRAVLLRESVLSSRNKLYHTVEAAGLLMAGFTPFFHATGPAKNFATGASIVSGPLLQAFNVIAPDRVVGQLNNLDDQSFRDSLVISNNAHVRTTIFMEKKAVATMLYSFCPDGAADNQLTEFRGTGQSSEGAKYKPAWTKVFCNAQPTDQPGHNRDQTSNSDEKARDNNSTQDTASQVPTGQPKNTSSKNKRSQMRDTEDNARQPRKHWYSVQSVFRHDPDFSPLVVKLALGSLVIVGDEIEYLQRVQVQSSAASSGQPALTLSTTNVVFDKQTVGVQSTTSQDVTLTNTGTMTLTGITVAISLAKDEFSQTNTCTGSLAPGASCAVSLKITPKDQQTRVGTLRIDFSGLGSPQTVSLEGTGVIVNAVPNPLNFSSSVKIGDTSTPQTVTITTVGGSRLTNLSATPDSKDFVADACSANSSCPVKFSPQAGSAGDRNGTLTIKYGFDGAAATQTLPVKMKGTASQ